MMVLKKFLKDVTKKRSLMMALKKILNDDNTKVAKKLHNNGIKTV